MFGKDNLQYDPAPPEASAFMGSIRASGYDFETAVADIIDNSISAGAKTVQIMVNAAGKDSWIAISDDGCGMDNNALVRAMTLGSISPSAPRDPQDLGRFGLGLKTASLSQCRRLTVFTKARRAEVLTRCWDLDFIDATGEWALLRQPVSPELNKRFHKQLDKAESGTVVLWELLDHIVQDGSYSEIERRLANRLPQIERHLSMVFHRFLEVPRGLRILIGDLAIKPWDPFMRSEKATQMLGEEVLEYRGFRIIVKPYVLPHISKLADTDAIGKGPRRWTDQQGFYVYRNRRLLVSGSWLRSASEKRSTINLSGFSLIFRINSTSTGTSTFERHEPSHPMPCGLI